MTYDLTVVLDHYGINYRPDAIANQQIICPFHDDRSPSASVHLEKGVFNCFTCGVGVNAVQFIMLKESVGFGEGKRLYEELVGKAGSKVQRESDSRGSYLPRREGSRPRGTGFRSPWASRRPGPST